MERELTSKVKEGFETIKNVSPELKEKALANLALWLRDDQFESYQPQIRSLIERKKWDVLLDSFYQVLPFGTGGRRGAVGVGPNRINPYTVASCVQGHVDFLKDRFGQNASLKVVIAYDVRVFNDLRGIFNADLPNPILGLSSKDLAKIAASVYAANGVAVYILPDDANKYISTPELSFLIRHFKCQGGLNVSASHNHPDDNGVKFYADSGEQPVPPLDQQMSDIVEKVTQIKTMRYGEAVEKRLILYIGEAEHRAYVALNTRLSLRKDSHTAHVVFTPLHGTGSTTVEECLRELGYTITPLQEQHTFDGGFPHVPFRIPNPEVYESMSQAMRKAKDLQADLVLATDPDADRIGAAVPFNGEFTFLTGNQIAALVTHYLLETLQSMRKLPPNPIVIKTEVTTELITAIARSFGAQVIGDLLVGFKYIADVLHDLETKGEFKGIKGTLNDFILGVEESHGILVTPEIRDKDAAGAAVHLAELTSLQKSQGRSVYDYLNTIYKKFGYYANSLTSTIMLGAAGVSSIARIQDELRHHPPKEVAGIKVVRSKDYWDEASFGPFKSLTDKASRNLLVFYLEGGMRILIRPSGTEPKNKIYYEAKSEPLGASASDAELNKTKEETDALLLKISHDFTKKMLQIIDIRLPDWALWVSDLVALDWKVDFAEKFIPELQRQAEEVLDRKKDRAEVQRWIDARLKPYGNDARGLVARAFRAYLDSSRQDPAKARTLEVMENLFFAR